MAKKKALGIPNRHVYSRISFLYQAASYMSTTAAKRHLSSSRSDVNLPRDGQHHDETTLNTEYQEERSVTETASAPVQNLSRKLVTDLRAVTLKSQMRISPALKRTICKYCDTLLVEGQTCSSSVENTSKGGKKPWADVLVIECRICGRAKRFPVSAARQKRRPHRATKGARVVDNKMADVEMDHQGADSIAQDQAATHQAIDERGTGT